MVNQIKLPKFEFSAEVEKELDCRLNQTEADNSTGLIKTKAAPNWISESVIREPEFITYRTSVGLIIFEANNPYAIIDFTLAMMADHILIKGLTELIANRWSYHLPLDLSLEKLIKIVLQFQAAYPNGRTGTP